MFYRFSNAIDLNDSLDDSHYGIFLRHQWTERLPDKSCNFKTVLMASGEKVYSMNSKWDISPTQLFTVYTSTNLKLL